MSPAKRKASCKQVNQGQPTWALLAVAVLLACGLTVFAAGRYFSSQNSDRAAAAAQARGVAWQVLEQNLLREIDEFNGEAGVVIVDLETGKRFEYLADLEIAAASLTKIPILIAALEAAEEGDINLSMKIALRDSHKLTGSGLMRYMEPGTALSVSRLLALMMYDSDNTATHIISRLVGLDDLRAAFKRMGLEKTNLARYVADYHARSRGLENVTTATEMAMLLEGIYHETLLSRRVSQQSLGFLKNARSTDRIPKYLPVKTLIAHKTGLERAVCHDAGIVFTPKGDFAIVVLTRHPNKFSTKSKELIARLSKHAYAFFAQHDPEILEALPATEPADEQPDAAG